MAFRLRPDFGAGGQVVRVGVFRVVKLRGDKGVCVFARQRLGPFHRAAHAGRAGGEHHLRAIGAHQLDALDAGRFRHHDDGAVAARRAQHAQADARVAAGGLDDQRARADAARLLRRAQHLQGGAILDAAAGIEIFQLGQQLPLQS